MDIFKLYSILNEGNTFSDLDDTLIDEMAMIVGDLETVLRKAIEENPGLEGNELKRRVKADPAVQKALNGDKLHDNQLNRFIAKVRSGSYISPGQSDAPGQAAAPSPQSVSRPAPEAEFSEPSFSRGGYDDSSSGLTPAKKEAIAGKLYAGATAEELAAEYGVSVEEINSLSDSDEEEPSDFEVTPDDEEIGAKPEYADLPHPKDEIRDANDVIKNKLATFYKIMPGDRAVSALTDWIANRHTKPDIDPLTQQARYKNSAYYQLQGFSDEEVESAKNAALGNKKIRTSPSQEREGIKMKGRDLGEPKDRGDANDKPNMGLDFSSFKSYSKTLSEQISQLKSTSVVRYPKQINFSEDFINKLREEYEKHSTLTFDTGYINNPEEKILKAIRMYLHEFAKEKEQQKIQAASKPPEKPKVKGISAI